MHILVVDDDRISLDLLEHALRAAGHVVQSVGDGRAALAELERQSYPMVITDWNMPGLDGPELCERIRATRPDDYVYVILLTMRDAAEDVVAGLSAGADDYICKPFNPAELAVRVQAGERMLGLQMRDVTIFALAKLAESRDPETGAHLERIRNYCQLLTQTCQRRQVYGDQIDSSFTRLVYATSPLHDIGKVGIPDCVLLKPGRLSPAEFEVMKTHTVIGAETLRAAADRFPDVPFLEMACNIARSHHEHYDGSGYPDGLAGASIPLAARILAIADVYDALTSKRVYKDAFTHSLACRIIQEGGGAHFDPTLVSVFEHVADEFAAIRDELCDAPPVDAPLEGALAT